MNIKKSLSILHSKERPDASFLDKEKIMRNFQSNFDIYLELISEFWMTSPSENFPRWVKKWQSNCMLLLKHLDFERVYNQSNQIIFEHLDLDANKWQLISI
ncbi:hypothetical protein [Pedobacter mendelii]|uniref:Uncharacterized protein n=1 Tax=Pedobacter mendelii TaxID=1908240 RepID=A0ABQ2BHQ3_9SPHI|nr:hypothetical protein [Pedobacter mendelii]GGI26512.1 hypothetical protein GCM10008119_23020 [Pedobacter mendelii]